MGFSTVFLVYRTGKGHVHARSLLLKLRFDGVRTVRGFSMFRFGLVWYSTIVRGTQAVAGTVVVYWWCTVYEVRR